MAQSRKQCLYKGCDNLPGRTLFRFPTDKERFCGKFDIKLKFLFLRYKIEFKNF